MARDVSLPPPAGEPLYARPWPRLVAGVGCSLAALGASFAFLPNARFGGVSLPVNSSLGPILFLLLTASAVLIGGVLQRRLRDAGGELLDRVETSAFLSLAGLAAAFAYLAMPGEWASFKTLFASAFIAAAAGSVLALAAGALRRALIGSLVVFHFVGMLVAVTVVDPPNAQGPYLSKQLWGRVYAPYLSFLYLTNAYHFYSPEPGAASVAWFSVQYRTGDPVWFKIPDRDAAAVGMQYQRLLALPEHVWQASQHFNANTVRGSWEDVLERRYRASGPKKLYGPNKGRIPFVPESFSTFSQQYREPNEFSKRCFASVARRILWHEAPERDGEKPLSVKAYRITHTMPAPHELAAGENPWDTVRYIPIFVGEFDRAGNLVDPFDPFLYWYVPMMLLTEDFETKGESRYKGTPYIEARFPTPDIGRDGKVKRDAEGKPLLREKTVVVNGLEMHARGLWTAGKEDK